MLVRPSACRVVVADRETRVEPRVMEVLVRLVRSLNQTVTRDDLIECCWGGRFVSDQAVTRVIYQVRHLARGVEPEPFVLETVPKVGFRLLAEAATLAQGDVAPSGSRGGAPSFAAPRRWPAAAAAIVALLAVAAAGWAAWRAAETQAHNGRVEVVQFEPLQAEPALRRYAVGLEDAVARVLSASGVDTSQRLTRRVAGWTPWGAEFRVGGTIDHVGDKYLIDAKVVDRRSGDILWARRFERDAAVAAAFDEEAANAIGDTLYCALWHRTASRRPMTSAVFSLFMNACVERRETGGAAPMKFVELTERIVRAAPDNAYAHSFNAVAHATAAADDLTSVDGADAHARGAEVAARRALQLDPRNGEAYQALAMRYGGQGHWLERERDFQRAIALTPTLPAALNYNVNMLREVGRLQAAAELNRRTIAADPFSASQSGTLAMLRGADGDLPEAQALVERMAKLNRERALEIRYVIAFWWEDPVKALADLRPYRNLPEKVYACHRAYLVRLATAPVGHPLRGLPPGCPSDAWGVRMLARQGDVDGAYAMLEAAPEAYRNPILFFHPAMRAFRRDPRFMQIAYRIGLVDYWRASGRWPDFCAEPDLPYDCRAVATALSDGAQSRRAPPSAGG
jgi:DNA-binding winged helix-turn-helix (wHTH) protein/tetratricopeptide (TPR) repeat protein/TolB-like protein